MAIDVSVPTQAEPFELTIDLGISVVFVGANGSGKTRLAVRIEQECGISGHRISAHRSLALNPQVTRIGEDQAKKGLRFGYAGIGNYSEGIAQRRGLRWGDKESIHLLTDYDFLVQYLYAERERIASAVYQKAKNGPATPGTNAPLHALDRLIEIFAKLLPHRRLSVVGDLTTATLDGRTYSATEMSDGERGIFYMLGQALMADPGTVLIVDEPELHMHPAILPRLWDTIEAERPDCAFVYVTHDLDFAASRTGRKIALRAYHGDGRWTLEDVPDVGGFDEALTTMIVGSRRPILFVEGTPGKLDEAVYRACYPDWTVVPRGSCSDVIHAVATLRNNRALHRLQAAGIVDGDGRNDEERTHLRNESVHVLDVRPC